MPQWVRARSDTQWGCLGSDLFMDVPPMLDLGHLEARSTPCAPCRVPGHSSAVLDVGGHSVMLVQPLLSGSGTKVFQADSV